MGNTGPSSHFLAQKTTETRKSAGQPPKKIATNGRHKLRTAFHRHGAVNQDPLNLDPHHITHRRGVWPVTGVLRNFASSRSCRLAAGGNRTSRLLVQ